MFACPVSFILLMGAEKNAVLIQKNTEIAQGKSTVITGLSDSSSTVKPT